MDNEPVTPADRHFGPSVSAPACLRQALHRHDEPRIILFLGGEMHEEAFEGQVRFVRGDFVFRPAHFAHADTPGLEGAKYVRLTPSAPAVRRWMAKNGWRASGGHIDLHGHVHADDLLATARARPYAQTTPSTTAQRAALLLAGDAALRVREAAHELGMAPYELTRCFSAEFGMTPSTYRRHARLHRAIQMLSEGAAHLAQIASAAGYHDQSHLTLELKREVGLTPGEMRTLNA